MFNRLTHGRTLDEVHAYGCDLWLSEVALAVCAQESLEPRFHHLTRTAFPAVATMSLSVTSPPFTSSMAIPKTIGQTYSRPFSNCWCPKMVGCPW